MPDLSRICDLHHSSWQRQILNPLSEARDRTCNLMVPSQIRYSWAMTGTPRTFFFLVFLGLHPRHMEVPRLGVQSELQLPAYTTATATPDLSRVCDLHHSSWQCRILNPLNEARDRTHTSWFLVGFVSAVLQRELLIVVLICIYLMDKNIEHLFVCLLAIWMMSFENRFYFLEVSDL